MEWIECEDLAAAECAAAEFIAERLALAVRERGSGTLAISGGNSPWGMFERLAAHALSWNAIHVLQVDERIVPLEHAARNWRRLLANGLTQRVPRSSQPARRAARSPRRGPPRR